MKEAYLRAHVFVCPSSIENSPNSLGEAQILGVPCVATYCGGIPSMIQDDKSLLFYPFEEFEMLSEKIRAVFSNDGLSTSIGRSAVKEAESRHSRLNNLNSLLHIYQSAVSSATHA